MEIAYDTLLSRSVIPRQLSDPPKGKDGIIHPFIFTMGGDHTIVSQLTTRTQLTHESLMINPLQVLPILRSLHKRHGPVTVLHLDSHIDTWSPGKVPSSSSDISKITHGTFFWKAFTEGLLANNSMHAGIRSKFAGPADLEHDISVGFDLIFVDEIDDLGVKGVIRRIRERVGNDPLYIRSGLRCHL